MTKPSFLFFFPEVRAPVILVFVLLFSLLLFLRNRVTWCMPCTAVFGILETDHGPAHRKSRYADSAYPVLLLSRRLAKLHASIVGTDSQTAKLYCRLSEKPM